MPELPRSARMPSIIEDLNVRGMVKNRHLARSIADMGFFEFRRQLEYKALMRGGQVLVADVTQP
jgi:putative transposase